MIRRHVVVNGAVQGVFFRDSVREHAEDHDVGGWVTNRADGAVEAVFEGEDEDVDAVVEFCRSGPDDADVEELEVTEEDPEGLSDFEVR